MDPSFLNRNVNEGFSGGEKKRNEILQARCARCACEGMCMGIRMERGAA